MSTVMKNRSNPAAAAPAKKAGAKFVSRTLPASAEAKRPTATMRDNARTYYLKNRDANRAYSEANRARKALYAEMKDAGIDRFGLGVEVPEVGSVRVEAAVETPEQTVMDVRKLWDILEAGTDPKGFEKFMATVSATRARVEQLHGKDTASRLALHVPGTENAVVREIGA